MNGDAQTTATYSEYQPKVRMLAMSPQPRVNPRVTMFRATVARGHHQKKYNSPLKSEKRPTKTTGLK